MREQLVDKYKPAKIADFAGLDRVRAIMTHLSKAPYSSSWLFVGDSGTGKTSMAKVLGDTIGAEIVHVASKECNKERVESLVEHCHYAPMFGQSWYLVIVDEADQMTKDAQIAFLSILDGTRMPPNTIFIFTANATDKLEDRFLSRIRKIEFKTDENMELAACALLKRIWDRETSAFAAAKKFEPNFAKLIVDAGGNVRTAVMDLELEIMAMESKIYTPAPASTPAWKQRPVTVGA